jgi:sugar phosphate isomerase/epimerase
MQLIHRRDYLRTLAAGALLTSNAGATLAAPSPAKSKQILIFVKPIQELSFADVAQWLEKWDVGGIEATVRKGGWIESNGVSEKLPQLMDALRKVDRAEVIMASDVNRVEDSDIKAVLEPAAKLGIRYFRMKYYRYDLKKPILPQLDRFIDDATKLAKVCEELKMIALYQNHAGADMVGAPMWDLAQLLDKVASPNMRLAIDTRHTTVEASEAWRINYARVRSLVGAIFVKDGFLNQGKPQELFLGEGNRAKDLFSRIWAEHADLPMSLHMEHIDHTKPELLEKRIAAITKDVATLKSWIVAKK